MKKTILSLTVSLSFALSPLSFAEKNEPLQILTWGGKYEEAQQKAFFKPFEEDYNTEIISQSLGESVISRLKAEVRQPPSKNRIDFADVTADARITACDENILVRIEDKVDKSDYPEGTVKPCGIANSKWSITISSTNPDIQTAEDFFDPSIPGDRGLKKTPRATLEFALMGAGIPKDEIYDKLKTEEGIKLAFETLNKIKDRIKWWEYSAQASNLLMSGGVEATTSYSSRMIYLKRFEDEDRHTIHWEDHIQGYGYFVIPKTSDNKDLALELMEYSTGPKNLDIWNYTGTSSMRNEIPKNATENYAGLSNIEEKALMQNEQFWGDYGDDLTERFNNWLKK